MTKGLDQLVVLVGECTSSSKKYSEGRGRMTVAPVDGGKIKGGGKTFEGQWEFSEDGKSWEVDFDVSYTKVTG